MERVSGARSKRIVRLDFSDDVTPLRRRLSAAERMIWIAKAEVVEAEKVEREGRSGEKEDDVAGGKEGVCT